MPDERGLLIVSSATYRSKNFFFFMVQSEFGDLYKVTLDVKEGTDTVTNLHVKYFDTIPVTNALCISKRGFLFAGSEFSNQCVACCSRMESLPALFLTDSTHVCPRFHAMKQWVLPAGWLG